MKIVIVGAGAVGSDLAKKLSRRENDVFVVERDATRAAFIQEGLDCRVLVGNGVNPNFLSELGMDDCDLFAAVSDSDQTNMISCLTAHRLGAKRKVARVRSREYYRHEQLVLEGIDLAISPDIEAVRSMRDIIWQGAGASDVHEFAGGRVRVVGAKVDSRSFIAGRSLAEIEDKLGSRWALVITVVRDGETLIPRGETVIRPDDMIYVAGARGAVDKALTYVRMPSEKVEHVMILGANSMGAQLARDLHSLGVHVKLIDRDEARCREVSEQLRDSLVLLGDGTDVDLLQSEGVDHQDSFVAVSKDEETNIMACLLAKHNGAAKTVCLVNRPDYVSLLPLLGVDVAISPRLSTSDAIARYVKRGAVVSTYSLGFSGSEILQFHLTSGCRCLNIPLSKLNFPRTAVIGAVLKRGNVVTPRGDTVMRAGDEVVVFALSSGVADVEDFFSEET